MLLETLQWREAGPHRGGRVVAVCGDPHDPCTFYFGACSGGVWKTLDAGTTWENVSDGFFKTAAVGAIAVAAADPNVVYAGTGEACLRGNVSHGDGVYRSTDAGRTWRNVGLSDTRHIGKIRIHPTNPDLVYVAALGHAFGPNHERGVFRSKDGGGSWEHVLFRNEDTGCVDLSMDPFNPRVLYAAFYQVRRGPHFLESGGPGSTIFKSADGGDSWTELTNGLPSGLKGRIGVAARGDRVWAMVEATDGGLYRSDDAGAHWSKVNEEADLRQRPWYYMHVFAHPTDPETVFVLNLAMHRSDDGGRTFKRVPAPHGDTHDLWIDPSNPMRMIEGDDGGATVSLNGGRTWSTHHNQPTAQFYHVTTDSRFPYRIYGAQQDNSTLSVPSRSDEGNITVGQCYPVGGGESGYIAVRPDDPDIVFAGSYASRMTRYNHRTGQQRDITVWPDDPIGFGAGQLRHRFQWTFPIVLSPHDPNVLYACGERVFRSTDEGHSFEAISPDLTRADPKTLEPSGGPITKDNVSTEFYATVFAFVESPLEKGLLWAGSDDGLVHLSRDHGQTWKDVTPKALPDFALISIIEASPHDPAVAYVAATRYKLDDTRPYLYKTGDYGETWTPIVAGIHATDFTRVIREDPKRRGLLYAGTETGVYASWDDGDHWRRLGGNLPVVPIHDLVVKDDDLILATHGRSFWILDDLAPLRADQTGGTRLFPPRTTIRFMPAHRWGERSEAGSKLYYSVGAEEAIGLVTADHEVKMLTGADNPPTGVLVQYELAEEADASLAFYDSSNQLINKLGKDDKVPGKVGLNRFVWNMRYPDATKLPDGVLSAYWGGSTVGPVAPPGTYRVALSVGDSTLSASFEIGRDPRIEASDEDLRAQFEMLLRIRDKLTEIHRGVVRGRKVQEQLKALAERAEGDLAERAAALGDELGQVTGELCESRAKGAADSFNYPPKVNSKLASLQSTVAFADAAPTRQAEAVYEELVAIADGHLRRLAGILGEHVPSLGERLRAASLPLIHIPD
jgi:photosystem II stability/assembly factor-like uncharacterized protein